MGQIKTNIYCFPGQGSDKRIFDSLKLAPSFSIKIIEYGTPEKDMSLKTFAKFLSAQIDTSQKFILLGVSLGGMICVELSEILHPEKTIIISSAKNRNDLPFRYKFQKAIPFYKLFPGSLLLAGAKILQPIVEPDRNKCKNVFKQMLACKSGIYMKRTIGLIINWDRKKNSYKIYQIHGANDHTLPMQGIKEVDYVITKGSHMMTLTRSASVNEILKLILKN